MLIMDENPEQDKTTGTSKLQSESGSVILPTEGLAYGTDQLNKNIKFIKLPVPDKRRKKPAQHNPWRIVFTHPNPRVDPIGVEIYDDVVIGLAKAEANAPDLDLASFGADEQGVSRRHALLRPTANQLFLIDLDSTNGTQVNSIPQHPGMARALRHNDALTMGKLHLTVKIVRIPSSEGWAEDQQDPDKTATNDSKPKKSEK